MYQILYNSFSVVLLHVPLFLPLPLSLSLRLASQKLCFEWTNNWSNPWSNKVWPKIILLFLMGLKLSMITKIKLLEVPYKHQGSLSTPSTLGPIAPIPDHFGPAWINHLISILFAVLPSAEVFPDIFQKLVLTKLFPYS
jgi:hypothetical protein